MNEAESLVPTMELSPFIVSDSHRALNEEIFVKPKNYTEAQKALSKQEELWIVGPSGVGKHTLALQLAQTYPDRIIYRIPRSTKWSDLARILQQASQKGSAEQVFAGISPTLFGRLHDGLLKCDPFNSNSALRVLFVDARISPWQHRVREAETPSDRVGFLIDLLFDQYNSAGENALSLFLQVLSARIDPGDAIHGELAELADDLEPVNEEVRMIPREIAPPATFILPDALGTVRIEREEVDSDLLHLRSLQALGHLFIVTSPDEVFNEAINESRLLENMVKPIELLPSSYGLTEKTKIFENQLKVAFGTNGISAEQQEWALNLLGSTEVPSNRQRRVKRSLDPDLSRRLDDWLPIDIYRFVFISLPEARRSNDIYELLRRNADINSRVHSWFMALDDSTKCFVFTLVLLAGHEARELWSKHKEIVTELRRLDPHLSVPTLGILRQRAYPHITQEGRIDFADPQVEKAVVVEVARNYREYFIELLEKFAQWSIPDWSPTAQDRSSMPQEELDAYIAETEHTRNAIAQLLGQVARYGLDDVLYLLEAWATHQRVGIRKTTGIALEQTVADLASRQQVIKTLQGWLDHDDQTDKARYRRWSVGSVLWRIAATDAGSNLIPVILPLLAKLARDRDHFVAYSAAYALMKMARHVPVAKMHTILARLAQRNDVSTQAIVALVVDEAARQKELNGDVLYQLLDSWIERDSSNRHFTVAYALLVGKNIPANQRYPRLSALMHADLKALLDAFCQTQEREQNEPERTRAILRNWLNQENALETRKQACLMLDQLVHQKQELALNLLDTWLPLNDTLAQWTAFFFLFSAKKMPATERYARLKQWLTSNALHAIDPLCFALADDGEDSVAWSVLDTLLLDDTGMEVRVQMARALEQATPGLQHGFLQALFAGNTFIIHHTAVYLLLVLEDIDQSERHTNLLRLITLYPEAFVDALREASLNIEFSDTAQAIVEAFIYRCELAEQKQVALALDNAINSRGQAVHNLLEDWEFLSKEFHWTIIYFLLTSQNMPQEERHLRLARLIQKNPPVFVNVLHEALNEGSTKNAAWDVLEAMLTTDSDIGQHLAQALIQSESRDTENVAHLLEIWSSSENNAIRWVSIYTLLVAENIDREEKTKLLIRFLSEDAATFVLALRSAMIIDENAKEKSLAVISDLSSLHDGHRKLLVATLAKAYQVQPAILHELRHDFLTAGDGRIASLPLEVDAQIIKSVIVHPGSVGVLKNLSLGRIIDAVKFLFTDQV